MCSDRDGEEGEDGSAKSSESILCAFLGLCSSATPLLQCPKISSSSSRLMLAWCFGVASSSHSVASLEATDRGELQREGGREKGECEEVGDEVGVEAVADVSALATRKLG